MASLFQVILYFFFIICVSYGLECSEKYVTVYVDAENGNDSTCLLTENFHLGLERSCKSLDRALQYRADCVSYVFLSPVLSLTSVVPFLNLHDLSFTSSNYTEVICSNDDVGLAFFNVSNLTFENISFGFCGAQRNSTSKNFNDGNFRLLEFRASLYMEGCNDVTMSSLSVHSSVNATGVVMYNTGGVLIVDHSTFSNNTVSDGYPGGGGFYLEVSYCIPGDSECVNGMQYINVDRARYSFENSHFFNNTASSTKNKSHDVYIIPFESNHLSFGRGGGLSVFMKGTAAYNMISVTNCTFAHNIAEWGGGSFVEFHDNTGANQVTFTNSTFQNNSCKYELTEGTGGGGLRIGHYVYGINDTRMYERGNRVEVMACWFLGNHAMYGGGISVSPTLQNISNSTWDQRGSVEVKNCTFQSNVAMMGAAVNINKFALFSVGKMLKMILSDLVVDSNTAFYADFINKSNTPHTEGVGALYIHQVYTTFQGHNIFRSNSHSAIAVVGTIVNFTHSNNSFMENGGYRGGGIALLGSAYLLISENTWMKFDSNGVRNEGGAIYNRYVEMDNFRSRSYCFVRHLDPFRLPNDWGATFIFKNNSDRRHRHMNSIHTSSILPCSWAGGSGINTNVSTIFCWENWIYFDKLNRVHDCKRQISSDAGYITFNKTVEGNDEVIVNATPGWDFNLSLSIKDDYNEGVINNIVFLLMTNQENSSTSYIWGSKANLKGTENSSMNVNLESLGDRIWEVNVIVDLQECPLGFILKDNSCTCPSGTYGGLFICDSGDKTISFTDNDLWLGRINGSSDSFIGLCPSGFCNTSFLVHTDNLTGENPFCLPNRSGVMCGQCIANYGPAINSRNYECINCAGSNLASILAKYIAAVYVPLTFLFLILIIFDIRLTTGPVNAFILYCQAVSSTFGLGVGQVPLNQKITRVEFFDKLYHFLYGIFNLEFIENLAQPWCLSPHFNTLTVLSLDYGVAIFPLLMIIIALIILKLKECPCRCSFRACKALSRVFHKLFGWRKSTIGEALLPAFAAFILLSYNKFNLISAYILGILPLIRDNGSSVHPSRVYFAGQYTTDNSEYVRYYYLPSVIAFAICCIIPLLLLQYPLKILEWCLRRVPILWRFYPVDKIHFFLDTFQGCYKTNMRFFAGLYFLFRLIINSAYLATYTWLEQFIIQQVACVVIVAFLGFCHPYRKENRYLNYVDILIFSNLLLINVLSLYLYIAIINGQHPSSVAPVVQYVLVFLPLLYVVGYIIYVSLLRLTCFKNYVSSVRRERRVGMPSRATISKIFTSEVPRSEDEYEEDLLQRAENTNQYRKIVGNHTVVNTTLEQSSRRNSERNSSRPSGSINRLSNMTTQTGSSHHVASTGYGTCGMNSSSMSSVKL